jgi:hypothetical protein
MPGPAKKAPLSVIAITALLLLILLFCTGCMSENTGELLSLPQLPDEYIELQNAINEVLKTGAVYSAPTAGSHRQSVQLYDINGDGTNEALAFFSTPGEKPLKIYVYEKTNNSYQNVAVIEGDGTDIENISYIDMDNDGWMEVIAGWQMSSDIQMLSIYSLKGFVVSSIATTDYTEYTTADMDEDGKTELLVIRYDIAAKTGEVEMYYINSDGETESSLSQISSGMENIARLTTGKLKDGPTALFVEGGYQASGLVTDIFISDDSQLKNITLENETGTSEDTIRQYMVYCRDMDNDGVMEVPMPRVLKTKSDTEYRVLDWYSYNEWGRRSRKLTTYHNYSDSWFLRLPDTWGSKITIRREDTDTGERGVVFSIWNGNDEPVTDFLIIYAITGENKEDIASKGERIILYKSNEVIYAAEILLTADEWSLAPDIPYLKKNFSLIYSEWITGLT